MIVKCEVSEHRLEWYNEKGECKTAEKSVLRCVFDEKYIECISVDEDMVWVLDENGNNCCELRNSDSLYIMYIQKHPRFGIGVVASVKNESDDWKDVYLVYNESKFDIATNAR